MKVQGLDEARYRVTAIVSTEEPGASGEIARASGWVLDRFADNPILLYNHQSATEDPSNVLGRVVEILPGSRGVVATVELDVPENPKAALVWEQIRRGTQRGFSVGFLPLEWVGYWSTQEELEQLTANERDLLESGEAYVIFTACELWELSLVTIPDKPGAVTRVHSANLVALPSTEELERMSAAEARAFLRSLPAEVVTDFPTALFERVLEAQ